MKFSQTDQAISAIRRVMTTTTGLLICLIAHAAIAGVLPGQTDQFADSKVTLRLNVPRESSAQAANILWRLSSNHRTLAHGRTRLTRADDVDALNPSRRENESSDEMALLEIATPKVNHGVVLEATLSLQLPWDESSIDTVIRLHHRDPLESIRQTLGTSGVALLDSTGITAAAFDSLSWQPQRVESLSRLDGPAIVILGESLRWTPSLIDEAEAMAMRGTTFIVLRPDANSSWPISLDCEKTDHLELAQAFPMIADTAKLDDRFWSQSASSKSGWELTATDKTLRIAPAIQEASNRTSQWRLIRRRVGDEGGGFLFVGMNLIERFDQSPVPRETLKRMLLWCLNDPKQDSCVETPFQSK